MVPELDDLAVSEPEEVDAGEPHPPAGGRAVTPRGGVRSLGRPASGDEIALAQDEVELGAQVGERGSEVPRDRGLPSVPGSARVRRRSCRT